VLRPPLCLQHNAQLIDAPIERDALFVHFGEIHLSVVLHAELNTDVALRGAYLAQTAHDFTGWLGDASEQGIAITTPDIVCDARDPHVPRQHWIIHLALAHVVIEFSTASLFVAIMFEI
jgi:hypothetical protein